MALPPLFPLAPVCVLLTGVLAIGVFSRALSAKGKGWLAFSFGAASLLCVLLLFSSTARGGSFDLKLVPWDGVVLLAYHIDGLSQLFALMAAGIGTAVLLFSVGYMAHDRATARFYMLMLVFIAGLIHLVYAADLFLMYLSWEIIGLCSFLLVGFWYREPEAARGARKVLVMTHIAGYGFLAAVLILHVRAGTTLWTSPAVARAFTTSVFLLMLFAAAAKSVQFPIHTWIPDAMAAPTPVSSLLHAACYVKAGVYLVARMHSFVSWPASWQNTVVWTGTVSLLVGALFAMVQSDLKRMLAFSTISQIGYMMLGLGLGTPLGIAAGLLHCLNHGLFKAGLFLCAGSVQHATGTKDMDRLGGVGKRMPKTMALWLIGAGAIGGIPLLSGFVSKWLIYNAALEAGQIVPALAAWIGSVLTVFYFLKATAGVFLGDPTEMSAGAREAPRTMLAGGIILGAGTIVLGLAPQIAVRAIINPLLPDLGAAPVIGVSWLGLTAGSGTWFSTAGFLLVLLAVAVGIMIYAMSRPVSARREGNLDFAGAASTPFIGGEPLKTPSRLSAGDFSLIIRTALKPFYRWMDMDLYYGFFWKALNVLCATAERAGRWFEKRALTMIAGLSAIVMIVLAVALPEGARTSGTAPFFRGKPLLIGVGAALVALLLSAAKSRELGNKLPMMAVSGTAALVGLLPGGEATRLVFLEIAALAAFYVVWKTSRSRIAGKAYLAAVLVSAAATIAGTLIKNEAPSSLVVALLLTGLAVKLAMVPLYLWLPLVAESVPAAVVGLVTAVVDVAAFGELLALKEGTPWLFEPALPWLAFALLSAFVGAVLMLGQKDLKRLLAFSTIEDMGYLVLGVTAGGELGSAGAAAGAAVHALAKALLFASLTKIEADGAPLSLSGKGMAARYPAAGAGFLCGALAMLGVPPTAGYPARWRLYECAGQVGAYALIILFAATALAVLAYSRVIAEYWWGGGDEAAKEPEPAVLTAALAALAALLFVFGLAPRLLTG
ncbi:MAG: proton-conducting transporter membrane subunit [Acidobacteriota bacterium]|nr:proton-conducting transporter membrane subunit [Acidobacteriota bacterium]